MITRAHVMPYVGQYVVVRTRDGAVHRGVLHSVSNDGIYVRPVNGRLASGDMNGDRMQLLGQLPDKGTDAEEAWLPFLFFPWFWIGAFWPWFWW
ncbi:hypothetical protein [Alicyclobacillus ferrooxydans]|uniref:Uncharacterized protein n=1 Tax=Alicyclobacillus ferrooxydans TaxID=471514 RepID=A0A0P9CYA6_9BACL|nr:hypothetical protein [Alicyclobacillus ferrooxydans]KPV41849.1 hypothetical protein AN477_20285 [Alicyclobacillus ferrooxydans]